VKLSYIIINQQTALPIAFCHQYCGLIAGWLCKQPQVTQNQESKSLFRLRVLNKKPQLTGKK
jgi:hypothetical protein